MTDAELTVEVLRLARTRITDPYYWTQGRSARDHLGNYAPPADPRAVCWCLTGALAWAAAQYGVHTYNCGLWHALGHTSQVLAFINDRDGHAAALAVLDGAIERAEAIRDA